MFMSQGKQLTRRQKELREKFIPFAFLLLMLVPAIVLTTIITGPLMHPNLHPRLVWFGSEMMHHHPRIMHAVTFVGISVLLGLYTAPTWLALQTSVSARKKGLLAKPEGQTAAYFDRPLKQSFTTDTPATWRHLQSVLPGLTIKVPGIRHSHWEVIEINDRFKQIKAALTYVHDPLGAKPSRLYPRTVLCTATVSGTGTKSDIQLAYRAKSAMDFQNACAIIDQTNNAIRESLRNDSHIKDMLARDATIRAAGRTPNGANSRANSEFEPDLVEVVSSTLELESPETNPIPEYKFYMPV
jgi:hypothetical protein